MALEAIYGHDMAIFENKEGLRYFQICISYDLPDGIEVCSKLSSANVCAKDEGCSDAKTPPHFTVTAKWVDAPQVCSPVSNFNSEILKQLGSNFVRLSCQHLFCVKCMETLCKMHVKEGSVFKLVCPDTKCNASIPPFVLKRLLTKEEFERWDRLVLKKALDSMSDLVYCPRCGVGCLEDQSKDAQCPKCSFIFCSLCKEPCHPAKQCITPEEKIKRQVEYMHLSLFHLRLAVDSLHVVIYALLHLEALY
ncbi:hypothetical protein HU200_033055 [Digitaria exilis]|uniref:RBR-type E3 ubiquitin transferase n=1 Tax=Digitaria exilis TaxID=1010633 RepID=A0A835BIZ2_9POAL|nr:hypothetical protein HU200_033055 [Digitaria exilis]